MNKQKCHTTCQPHRQHSITSGTWYCFILSSSVDVGTLAHTSISLPDEFNLSDGCTQLE
jgi:hypothetical protein